MTPSAAFEIAQTESHLAELRQRQLDQEREANVEKLKNVRAELLEKSKTFERLKRQIEKNELSRVENRRAVRGLEEQEAVHLSERPQVFLFVPEDPECIEWSHQHAKIETALARAREKLFNIPQSDFAKLVKLGGAVQALQFSERNLLDGLTDAPNPQKHFQIGHGVNEAR